MPWTLYRYILWDILKLMAFWTLLLSLLVSVALSIKPLSDGLLQPIDFARFIMYTLPTLVVFTAPFAGALAATLVFCRLSADNEIVAALACGLSYRRILLPIAVMGWCLSMGLFYMSNWVVPRYYQDSARIIQRDIMRTLARQLNENKALKLDDMVIYANDFRMASPEEIRKRQRLGQVPEGLGVNVINLMGVAIGEIDSTKRTTRWDLTAERADGMTYEDASGAPLLLIKFENASHFEAGKEETGGSLATVQRLPLIVELPRTLEDKPKYLTWNELIDLQDRPENVSSVADRKRELVQVLAADKVLKNLEEQLKQRPQVGLRDPVDDRIIYWFSNATPSRQGDQLKLSPSTQAGEIDPSSGSSRVLVEVAERGTPRIQYQPRAAEIRINPYKTGQEPRIEIELIDVRVFKDGILTNEFDRFELPPLNWSESYIKEFQDELSLALIEDVAERVRESQEGAEPTVRPVVVDAANRLDDQIARLDHRVQAILNRRAATSLGCMLVLLLGAVLSLKAQGKPPLVIFIFPFLMCVLMIVLVHGGENFVLDIEDSLGLVKGLTVIWSANLLLLLAIALAYWRLRRT